MSLVALAAGSLWRMDNQSFYAGVVKLPLELQEQVAIHADGSRIDNLRFRCWELDWEYILAERLRIGVSATVGDHCPVSSYLANPRLTKLAAIARHDDNAVEQVDSSLLSDAVIVAAWHGHCDLLQQLKERGAMANSLISLADARRWNTIELILTNQLNGHQHDAYLAHMLMHRFYTTGQPPAVLRLVQLMNDQKLLYPFYSHLLEFQTGGRLTTTDSSILLSIQAWTGEDLSSYLHELRTEGIIDACFYALMAERWQLAETFYNMSPWATEMYMGIQEIFGYLGMKDALGFLLFKRRTENGIRSLLKSEIRVNLVEPLAVDEQRRSFLECFPPSDGMDGDSYRRLIVGSGNITAFRALNLDPKSFVSCNNYEFRSWLELAQAA